MKINTVYRRILDGYFLYNYRDNVKEGYYYILPRQWQKSTCNYCKYRLITGNSYR